MKFKTMADRVFIALDVPSALEARAIIDKLDGTATSYKVGLQLFCTEGPGFVREMVDRGYNVFLDLKFHDIPNTAKGAVSSVAGLGVAMTNVHCSGGPAMLRAAREALSGPDAPALLGVTVLTSLDENTLKELGIAHTTEGQVLLLARMAYEAGLDGVVCSPKEIGILRRELGENFLLVTPGIRPAWAAAGDQKRIMTPKQAFEAGASAIVVGRPVTGAEDQAAAMRRLLDEC